jgi:hypothetical protein
MTQAGSAEPSASPAEKAVRLRKKKKPPDLRNDGGLSYVASRTGKGDGGIVRLACAEYGGVLKRSPPPQVRLSLLPAVHDGTSRAPQSTVNFDQ